MSDEKPNVLAAIENLQRMLAASQDRERARRDAMTVQERRAEDEARQRQAAAGQAAKVLHAVKKAAAAYRQHGSFTLVEFACLLHGHKPPAGLDKLLGTGPHDEVAAVGHTLRVLGSIVRNVAEPVAGLPLYPVNPAAPEKEHRFPRTTLLQAARDNGLGHATILADVLGAATWAARDVPAASTPAIQVAMVEQIDPRAEPLSATPVAVTSKVPWQRVADALMEEVITGLRARADASGRPYEVVKGELLRRSSMEALHEESNDRAEAGQRRVEKDTFARYVSRASEGFRFIGGKRNIREARRFLTELLDG